MSYPKVSVIIPSYNHARFVEAALLSVDAQTYPHLEIIVVDDGSRDRSVDVVQEARARMRRKPVVMTQSNRGAHAAINRGLRVAEGKYVNILNSDDLFSADRLELLVECLEHSGSELAFSKVRCVDEEGRELGESSELACYFQKKQEETDAYPSIGFALLDSNVAISSGNIFGSRRLFEALGGFRALSYCHDWDFLLRAVTLTEPRFIHKVAYFYRLHGQNTFRGLGHRARKESAKVLRTYFSAVRRGRLRNATAPSPEHWPEYFHLFAAQRGYLPFLSRKALIRSKVSEIGRIIRSGGHG